MDEETNNKINIHECTELTEEDKGNYAVTLMLDDNDHKKYKILIPYGHRAEQHKWIDNINSAFIRGRVRFMSLEENIGKHLIYSFLQNMSRGQKSYVN